MKRQLVKLILVAAMILLLGGQSAYAIQDWSFDLLPTGGNVSGPAGSTVGWGYTITNLDPAYYLELTSISADLFLNGDPLELFDFPTVAPGESVSVPFDGINGIGLYQLTWYPAAPVGFVNSGTFILSADWWQFTDNALIFVETAVDKSAEYSATVTSVAVPEPSTWLLMVSGLAGIVVLNTIMLRWREPKAAEGQT